MATIKGYELKKGVLLQAFGDASKTCTNDTLTDELAEWYLKNFPEKAIYFSRIPVRPAPVVPKNVTIVEPKKVEPKSDFQPMTVMENALNNISKAHIEAEKKSDAKIVTPPKRTTAKRKSKTKK